MIRRNISGGSSFEEVIGYSRVVDDGTYVFVSGTAGFDYGEGTISEEVVEQARQTFRNIETYLGMAECSLSDIVKATYIITEPEDWQSVVPVIGEYMREVRPVATAFVARLVDPKMKIEIDVTARRPDH
jgi:enamine deaminase RidA (YjgF/YER057c/UK114 family)|tara:strand:+ start:327 stop:713 length:387 start_codon:yes stop_codon:yes gene_type:complete